MTRNPSAALGGGIVFVYEQRFNNTEATSNAASVSHALVGEFIVRSDRSRTSLVVIVDHDPRWPANPTMMTASDRRREDLSMRFLSEEQTAALITHELAYDAVKSAFISAASDTATVFPAVIAHGADPANVFTIKSGSSTNYAGVKIGSYWPGNDSLGIPRHGTTVLVIDQATGHIAAAVEAAKVNAYRTAAADAVAADLLALPDARTLAVFGNGHQALYECLALTRIRPIERILVVARDPGRGDRFCRQLADHGLHAVVATAQQACTEADIITAATNATSPLFDATWVTPGTHVASIGSDSRGKQELPTGLHDRARLFCDLPTQSVNIGEFQHVANRVASGALTLTAIGSVLNGTAPGRVSANDITVFDSSGIALQDLAVATALLDLAR